MKLNVVKANGVYVPATDTDMAAIVRARNGELHSNQSCTITVFAYKHPCEISGQDPRDDRTYQEFAIGTYWIDGGDSEWIARPNKKLMGRNLQWVSRVEIIPDSMRSTFSMEIRWKE